MKSVKFYENLSESEKDHKLLELEINKLKSSLGNSNTTKGTSSQPSWADATSGIVLKTMIIGTVLVVLNTCNGTIAISGYMSNMFEDTGSNMSPNMSAIVIGVIQLIGTCVAMKLVDRFGRKVNEEMEIPSQ